MSAATEGQERAVAPAPDRRELVSISHYHNAEHRANERTHLAYMRTAIAVISLGTTMNRFRWMVLALHRYRQVEQAIDNGDFQSQRRLIEWLTLIALLGAAVGIIWMFLG